MACICGQTISPVYKNIQSTIREDMENVARLFSELGPLTPEDEADQDRVNDFILFAKLLN